MKKHIISFFFLILSISMWGQSWTTYSGSLYSPTSSSSYVGIGVIPQYKLDIAGKVCIRPCATVNNLHVSYLHWLGHILTIGTPVGEYAYNYLDFKPGGSSSGSLYTTFRMFTTLSPNSSIEKIHLTSLGNCWFNTGGNVGIGTTTPNYTLDVYGTIRANEIIVNTTGADFVFEDEYELLPLDELSEYLKENHHLPDIKSAEEMQDNGVGVSELQTQLLQKIEELTLYIIQQQGQIEALQKEVCELNNQHK